MRHFIPALLSLLSAYPAFAQLTGIKWQRSIGGSGSERFHNTVITRSGLLICAGYTTSVDGEGTGNHGNSDVLLTAFNKNGVLLWKKLIGGSSEEGNLDKVGLDTLADGNLIVAFSSTSSNGDVPLNRGNYDLVFCKYTTAGQLLWTKVYGGSGTEFLTEVKATPDGGCIAIASTTSNNSGDVGANHGVNTFDNWILKLDAAGSLQWQRCYGGSLHDGERQGTISPTSDGGYVFATTIGSTDGDLTGLVPAGTAAGVDIWLVKINAVGAIEWSKQIGGSDTEDGPLLTVRGPAVYLSFASRSNNRDLTSNTGLFDVAVFKYWLNGTQVWKGVYGGFSWDSPNAIAQNIDGNLAVTAVTYSTQINGVPITSRGQADILLLRIDSLNGSLRWAKTFGGTDGDFAGGLVIDANGDHYLAGLSSSNNYDITGNKGGSDAVLLGLLPGNTITGTVYIDRNNNGQLDAADTRPNYVQVKAARGGVAQAGTLTRNGDYTLEVDTGRFVTAVQLWKPQYYTAQPDSFITAFTGAYQTVTQNIRLKPVAGIRDLRVSALPLGVARPAFTTEYLIIGYNAGTDTVATGTLSFRKDPRVSFTSFSTPPSQTIGDSLVWNFTNLKPFDSLRINVKITTPRPPAVNAGDFLRFYAAIASPVTDVYPSDNRLELYHLLIGPLDPNEKINLNGGRLTQSQVQSGEWLNYVIHFQNVGTASAFDVVVRDTFSAKLVPSSLEVMAASHPFAFALNNTEAVWRFKDINLPDSTTNKEGSKGFVVFRIKVRNNLAIGDTVGNHAAIYFDYNAPVITGTDTVRVVANPVICRIITNNTVSAATAVFCGSAANVTLNGTVAEGGNGSPGYQWQMKNGTATFADIAGATSQTYTSGAVNQTTSFRRVVVSGCSSDTSNVVTVTVVPLPPVPTVAANGNVLTSSAPAGNQWYFNGVAVTGATGPSFIATASGLYTVTVTGNGCASQSAPFTFTITAVSNPTLAGAVTLWPNPVQDKLFIQSSTAAPLALQVWDISGKRLLFQTLFVTRYTLAFRRYSKGAYLVQLFNSRSGERMQRIVMKQ